MYTKYKLYEDSSVGAEACKDIYVNGGWRKGIRPKNYSNMVHSLSYKRWNALMVRTSKKYEAHNHYKEVFVEEGMKDYDTFTEWYMKQKGYGYKGLALEKDILSDGNYTFENCVLVPEGLNSFVIGTSEDSPRYNGYPLGVYTDGKKYLASSYHPVTRKKIRRQFKSVVEAMKYWQELKTNLAKVWLQHILDNEYPIDTRIINWLKEYKFEYQESEWIKYNTSEFKF